MFKLLVMVSGFGSNLQAIIDHCPADIQVISDNPNAYGLTRAQDAGLKTHVIKTKDKQQFNHDLLKCAQAFSPDLIALAGFMRILSADFIQPFEDKIINIHPSLLPQYKGLNTHQRVLDAGDKIHGTTLHFVNEALDAGPIIAQGRISLENHDNASTLKDKVQKIEHILYPIVINWFIDGRISKKENTIYFDNRPIEQGIQFTQQELEMI